MSEDAYAAGLIDGEAHVYTRLHKNHYGNYVWRGAIAVSMTDEPVVQWLHERYGGSVHFVKKREDHHKQQWRWTVAGRQAYLVAKAISPWSIVKKAALLSIVDHYETGGTPVIHRKNTRGEESGSAKLTWEKVNAIRAAMKVGKRYGRVKALCQKFDIEASTVHRIVRNEIWVVEGESA